jgi:hypothetical protein
MDVLVAGFRGGDCRPICTAGWHIGIKKVRAPVGASCSGNRYICILSACIRRVHLWIPALDGMWYPPVDIPGLRKLLVVHFGKIHTWLAASTCRWARRERTKKMVWIRLSRDAFLSSLRIGFRVEACGRFRWSYQYFGWGPVRSKGHQVRFYQDDSQVSFAWAPGTVSDFQ